MISGEGVVTGSTGVGEVSTIYSSYGSMVSNLLALGVTASVLTSGGSITGSGSHFVTGSGNSLGSGGKNSATNGTLNYYVLGTFSLATGIRYDLILRCAGGMIELSVFFLVTAKGTSGVSGTGSGSHRVLTRTKGLATAVFTSPHFATSGRLGHLVTKSSVFISYGEGLVTDGTSTSLSAVSFTGSVVVRGEAIIVNGVSGSGNCFLSLGDDILAEETSYCIYSVTILGTGGSLAKIGLRTLGHRHVCAGSRNFFLRNGGSTTNGALLTIGETCSATGGSSAINGNVVIMAGSGNYFLLNGYGITNCTLLTSGETGLGTGRIYCGNYFLGMTVSANLNLGVVITVVTSFVCIPAALGTSSFLSGMLNEVVSGCGNGLLCLGNSVTYGTLLTSGETGLGTGRILSLKGHFSVTERGALCYLTGFTGFGSGTSSCGPIMAGCRAFGSITLCTGLRCCTSCCCPFVSASLIFRLTRYEYEQKDQCENQQRNLFHGSFFSFFVFKVSGKRP